MSETPAILQRSPQMNRMKMIAKKKDSNIGIGVQAITKWILRSRPKRETRAGYKLDESSASIIAEIYVKKCEKLLKSYKKECEKAKPKTGLDYEQIRSIHCQIEESSTIESKRTQSESGGIKRLCAINQISKLINSFLEN